MKRLMRLPIQRSMPLPTRATEHTVRIMQHLIPRCGQQLIRRHTAKIIIRYIQKLIVRIIAQTTLVRLMPIMQKYILKYGLKII